MQPIDVLGHHGVDHDLAGELVRIERREVHVADGAQPRRGQDHPRVHAARVELGAGEIVVNSIDADGTRAGYDLELLRAISAAVTVPVVASGGAGNMADLYKAVTLGKADAVLAASIFHYAIYSIRATKQYLADQGIPVRL